MRAIVIPPDGPIVEVQIDDLDSMQAQVGGPIEHLGTPHSKVAAFCNEEGKIEGLPTNVRATALLRGFIRPDDYIVGNLLLTGFRAEDGETVDFPDDLFALYHRTEDE